MDSHRFDALARALVTAPQSRRSALRRLTGGIAVLSGAAALWPGRTPAQDGTPAATTSLTEFLSIQSFASGTLAAKEGEAGAYELVLRGGTGQTAYFADRPERQVGVAPTARVLAAVGFDPAHLPNGGLVAQTDDGERVGELETKGATRHRTKWNASRHPQTLQMFADELRRLNASVLSEGWVGDQ